jgi:hypothetical protein
MMPVPGTGNRTLNPATHPRVNSNRHPITLFGTDSSATLASPTAR